jgi:hypothetical protein
MSLQTNPHRLAALPLLLVMLVATTGARASHFEFCELHGRIASGAVDTGSVRLAS